MKKLLLVFALFAWAALGNAEIIKTNTSNDFTLDEYIRLYLQNSPEVINTFNALKKAEINFKNKIIDLFLPSANFYAGTEITSKENPGIHFDNPYDASLSLSWNLFNSGKDYLAYLQQKNTLKLARLNFENTMQDIALRAIQTYYDLKLKESLLLVADNDLKSKKQQFEITTSLYKAGLQNYTSYLQGDNNFQSAQLSAKQKKAIYDKSRIIFNNAIARTPEEEVVLNYTLDEMSPLFLPSYEEDLHTALLNRYDINQKIITLQNEKLGHKITTLRNLPALNAGFSLSNSSRDIFGDNSNYTNYSLGLSLNVPIGFVGIDNYYNIELSKISLTDSYMGFEDLLRNIRKKILDTRTELALQEESIKISEGNLKIAKERLDITKKKYDIGDATALELADAQNAYLAAENSATTYRYEYQLNQFSYKRELGLPIYDISKLKLNEEFVNNKIKQIDQQFLKKK